MNSNKLVIKIIVIILFSVTLFNSCKKDEISATPITQTIIVGCMDTLACNYDITVTQDNGSCIYAELYYDCSNNCINDFDSDGICDELEIAGCNDPLAFNFNSMATDNDGSCEYAFDIMLNTWNMTSDCDGLLIGTILPSEITVSQGLKNGDLILDLGAGLIINGQVDNLGNITIPNQTIGFEIASFDVSGSGQLNSTTSAIVNILFIEGSFGFVESCILTLTL
tara:strand:+ start:769 stop:1440 length:672 start_codon:yes stop_codon:yes gene_type:complete